MSSSADTLLLEQCLMDTVVESWRFSRLFERAVSRLGVADASRYANQLRYFQGRLSENLAATGCRLVNLEGEAYTPGMAAAPLNIADFSAEDELVVDQMVEPIIMGPDGLKREGSVMLRKVEK